MLDVRAPGLDLAHGPRNHLRQMQKLLGVNKVELNDLAKRGIVKRGERKGTYGLQASVGGYCAHLREVAASKFGDNGAISSATVSRGKLADAQARLAETKADQLRGELVPAAEVEALWTSKLKTPRTGFSVAALGA